jgi:phage baseplate assembly protein W
MEGSSVMALGDRKEIALSFPFSLNDYGNITVTSDPDKIWKDRVAVVVGTQIGERVMRPQFGTKVAFAAWTTRTAMEEIIRKEVGQAFQRHLPLLTLENINFAYSDLDNIAQVEITYALPDNRQATTNVGVVVLNENNPPYEETT